MINNRYKIADKVVEINSLYENVHQYCAAYRTEEAADYMVTITQEDIDFTRDRSEKTDIAEGRKPVEYSDGYLEQLAVYRKIAEQMIEYDTILFHGSCIAVDGQAYLFTAKSGTGKSTHTRFWRDYFGDRAVMVNDDKPLLRCTESGVIVYGTPYNGKHNLGCNMSAPLKALCILTRDTENHIERIGREAAYPMLLQQTHRPADGVKLMKTLTLIDRLRSHIPLYRLGCNLDPSAARVAFEGMQ